MSNDPEDLEEVVELPHNAWIDSVTGTVSFAIDRFTLTFDVNEFFTFAEQMEDIAVVLKQMLVTETEQCPTCGSHVELTLLDPPTDTDFN